MININILTWREGKETFLYMLDKKRYPETEYHIVENSDEDIVWDLVVVYEDIVRPHTVRYRKGGLVFISGEPPMSHVYATPFLKQFDTIITQHPTLHHPNNIQSQPCLNWHLATSYKQGGDCIFSFDEVNDMQAMSKTKNISMITSALRMMPGHNHRMNFVEAMKERFGDKIDLFGRGIKPVDTKYEALKDYRFAICIENSNIPHYWTEKFADPILSYTVPIYFGCTNINDYFDPCSYIAIDISDTEKALDTLQHILDNAASIYEEHLPYVKEARRKLIEEYNLFPTLIDKFAQHLSLKPTETTVTLHSRNSFWQHKWLVYKLRLTRLFYKFKLGGARQPCSPSRNTSYESNEAVSLHEKPKECPVKLSFIVPVYNVEKYVKRCLESILAQDVDKSLYEVIVVNDGSTDNSLQVVEETVAGYGNVSVQSSANFGQSAARNRGTLSARGEYIWFVDSDDWIEPYAVRTLLPYMQRGYDIIQFTRNVVYADGSVKLLHIKEQEGTGRDVLLQGPWSVGPCSSLYRHPDACTESYKFKFVEGIFYEDNEFTPRILHHAKRVIALDIALYNVNRANFTSITATPNYKKCCDILTVSKMHVDYAKELNDIAVRKFFLDLAAMELNTALTTTLRFGKADQDNFINKVQTEYGTYLHSLLGCGKLRYRIMASFIIATSVRSYFKVLHLRNIH